MRIDFPKKYRSGLLAALLKGAGGASVLASRSCSNSPTLQRFNASTSSRGFTMMEIAISLAIIGIALVAIIGVLPIGMNVQRDNRQETVIGQDASVLIEDVRNGGLGEYDLTNYVYAISNYWMEFNPARNSVVNSGVNGYTYAAASCTVPAVYPGGQFVQPLTNNANIIGLVSTPEFTDQNGNPTANIYNALNLPVTGFYISNHVVAYVYSISGPAYEKPPQDNSLMQQSSFGYRIYCVNTTEAVNTNMFYTGVPNYNQQMLAAVHELRLTFEWPQLPNGNLGSGRQTFRTLVAGQLVHQPFPNGGAVSYNPNLYVYQSQSFVNSP
jgi:prepilin-type N-terminal cleavage/methylation domain-containing protein